MKNIMKNVSVKYEVTKNRNMETVL